MEEVDRHHDILTVSVLAAIGLSWSVAGSFIDIADRAARLYIVVHFSMDIFVLIAFFAQKMSLNILRNVFRP